MIQPIRHAAILRNYAKMRGHVIEAERLMLQLLRHPDVTTMQLKEAQVVYSRAYKMAFDCYRSISGLGFGFALAKPGMQ